MVPPTRKYASVLTHAVLSLFRESLFRCRVHFVGGVESLGSDFKSNDAESSLEANDFLAILPPVFKFFWCNKLLN